MSSTLKGRKRVEDMCKVGWIYVGGECKKNDSRHKRYWDLCKISYNLADDDLPPHLKNCECGEEIRYNCWIFNKETREIKVVGGVCIKQFTNNMLRVCDECGEPHKNRVINKCNECRNKLPLCVECGEPNKYLVNNKCRECRRGYCEDCGKSINPQYKRCYDCYILNRFN